MSETLLVEPRGGRARKFDANGPLKLRKDDCYETHPSATLALLRVEPLPHRLWEPACGPGAMVKVLRGAGHDVVATDLVDYGCPDARANIDFLMELQAPEGVEAIVTNPPYKLADAFVRQGLRLAPKVIMLLRLAYLEGARRSDIIDRHLARVWLGRERLPTMFQLGSEVGERNSNAIPFAWFVFTREPNNGVVDLRRMSWREAA